jgi:ribosomal protein S18 acetylase RimI-like enzyme
MKTNKSIYIKFFEYLDHKNLKFVIDKNNYKFKLFLDGVLVAETGFSIEEKDEWFDKKYATLFNLKTIKNFQKKGFMKYLLENIFDHVKNELEIDIITLNVYKKNYKAIKLYFNCGFEEYINYDDDDNNNNSYFTLIKKIF